MAKKKQSVGTAPYRAIEDHIRTVLKDPAGAGKAAYSPEQVHELERRYNIERNPVDVWEAIVLLHLRAQIAGEPLVLPNWVLAYLVRAAEVIVGGAVERPEKVQAGPDKGKQLKKSSPPPPERHPDGTTSSYSDWFGGCTPKERLRLAEEALGFKGDGTMNALVHAHRQRRDEDLTGQVARLKREGLTDKQAVDEMKDDALRNLEDPVRKVRRTRRGQRSARK